MIKKVTQNDIAIRQEPEYPGDRTGEFIEGIVKVKVDKKISKVILHKNQNIRITFYHMADNRGWIFNIDPENLENAFSEV